MSSNYVNFWTNGMTFLKIIFNILYKGGLTSSMLCKQLVHVYDVVLFDLKVYRKLF